MSYRRHRSNNAFLPTAPTYAKPPVESLPEEGSLLAVALRRDATASAFNAFLKRRPMANDAVFFNDGGISGYFVNAYIIPVADQEGAHQLMRHFRNNLLKNQYSCLTIHRTKHGAFYIAINEVVGDEIATHLREETACQRIERERSMPGVANASPAR